MKITYDGKNVFFTPPNTDRMGVRLPSHRKFLTIIAEGSLYIPLFLDTDGLMQSPVYEVTDGTLINIGHSACLVRLSSLNQDILNGWRIATSQSA